MGAVGYNRNNKAIEIEKEEGPIKQMKKPLIGLRNSLLKNLNITSDHHYHIFVNYRFWTSYRKSV